ncbi:hypothetical protein [Streptomyces sp. NBC_01207]|uniref:hypothetical protein n=1 Tax=Streptomyces sp. NBC_01207 TaxID=2903772 RepID=UPI003FA3BA2B
MAAGLVLYRVLAVKHAGERVSVAVDGGTGVNPRPALYGVRYAPRLIGRRSAAGSRTATVVGRRCGSGGIPAADVPLPADVGPGDLPGVPVAGAYQLSMAAADNLVGRPPVIAAPGRRARGPVVKVASVRPAASGAMGSPQARQGRGEAPQSAGPPAYWTYSGAPTTWGSPGRNPGDQVRCRTSQARRDFDDRA